MVFQICVKCGWGAESYLYFGFDLNKVNDLIVFAEDTQQRGLGEWGGVKFSQGVIKWVENKGEVVFREAEL